MFLHFHYSNFLTCESTAILCCSLFEDLVSLLSFDFFFSFCILPTLNRGSKFLDSIICINAIDSCWYYEVRSCFLHDFHENFVVLIFWWRSYISFLECEKVSGVFNSSSLPLVVLVLVDNWEFNLTWFWNWILALCYFTTFCFLEQAPNRDVVTLSSGSDSSPRNSPSRPTTTHDKAPERHPENDDSIVIGSGEDSQVKAKKAKNVKVENRPILLEGKFKGIQIY